jgi:type I restriction enzyme S subunit
MAIKRISLCIVTDSLSPFTPAEMILKFRDSDLGKIPHDWSVIKLSDLARVEGGYAFKSSDYVSEGIKLIRITNVSFGRMYMTDTVSLPHSYSKTYGNFLLNENDIIEMSFK